MADEKNIEEKYMQLQLLQQQVEQITDYVEKLQVHQKELEASIEALTELQKVKVNTEILAPIANGIFMKAELKDNQTLVVNIGADVTAEKSVSDVLKLLREQSEKIKESIMETEGVLKELHEHGRKFYQEINEVTE